MNLSNLDEKQREAVLATQGYVVDIAGAGSGKTTALTYRYAYLVNELGIPPASILCVTFTNKAAREMKERISTLIGKKIDTSFVCTLHSFCLKVLLRDIECLPFSGKFSIMDTTDQKTALKEVYSQLDITPSEIPLNEAIGHIEKCKTSGNWTGAVEKLIAPVDPIVPESMDLGDTDVLKAQIYLKYLCFQRKSQVLDFTDLITFTVYLFRNHPARLAYWSDKFVYQMVDEAQDNSIIQWELIRLLSGVHKNLFVVGDPDQAIYSFRGAKPEGLVNFSRNFTPCTTIVMARNYRSTGHILNAANEVISNNRMRIHKDLYTDQADGEKIDWMHAGNESEETEFVAGNILALQRNNVDNKDIAVLFRASYQSRIFEQEFVRNKIPYVIWGGTRFFEREEVKNCLAYLRLIAQSDDLSFLRVINYPARKLGNAFINKVKEASGKQRTTYYDALRNNLQTKELGNNSAVSFVGMIEELRQIAAESSLSYTMEQIIERTGIRKELLKHDEIERIENIQELIGSISHYETEHSNDSGYSIEEYLQEVSLLTNMDGKDDPKAIKMMTIHQAKGLEFPYVFIVGMSDGNMPHARTLNENRANGLEEERRLAYVAITRARKKLFISDSEGYSRITSSQCQPSRFIFEIHPGHMNAINSEKKDFRKEQTYNAPPFVPEGLCNPTDTPAHYNTGQRVKHPLFGEGEIIEVDIRKSEYKVRFVKCLVPLPVSMNYKKLILID